MYYAIVIIINIPTCSPNKKSNTKVISFGKIVKLITLENTMHLTLYNVHCILYSVHCTVYMYGIYVHCTVYIMYSEYCIIYCVYNFDCLIRGIIYEEESPLIIMIVLL